MVIEGESCGINGRAVHHRRRVVAAGMGLITTACGLDIDSDASARTRAKNKDRTKSKKKKQKSGDGEDVVKVALKYKGARYVWGGESPRGFDCSGLTWYCYQKAVGMEIGRTVKAQWKQGRSVGRGDWQPGDLVFFRNTFEHGLSHNGIYIGGDKFIHAENERTGVVVTSLASDYYKDHYAGARRLL